jgi:hypothetical protein
VIGHPLWAKANDVMYSMTCDRVEGCDLVCMDCALGRCLVCPPLKLVRYEASTDDNDPTKYISWNHFETQYKCKKHGYLETGKCPQCQALPVEQQPAKKPMSTIDYTNKRASIGTFIKDVFKPFLVKLRYHIFLVTVLSKNHCVKDRSERHMKTPTGKSVLIIRDYSDHLNAAFTGEAQSAGMGDKQNTGMEGITIRYFANGDYTDEESPEVTDWYVYLSDEKQQDARTSMVNSIDLIEKLQAAPLYLLPRGKDAVLYEQSDGCAKQYKCATALWVLSHLSHKYRITINRMVTAPHHGKGSVDALAGVDKNFI